MRACQLHSPAPVDDNPLVWSEVDVPKPGDVEVGIKVHACGICRTDLHIVEGELSVRRSPVIPGHQVVGTIDTLGTSARRFALGQRVGVAASALRGARTSATSPPSRDGQSTAATPST